MQHVYLLRSLAETKQTPCSAGVESEEQSEALKIKRMWRFFLDNIKYGLI